MTMLWHEMMKMSRIGLSLRLTKQAVSFLQSKRQVYFFHVVHDSIYIISHLQLRKIIRAIRSSPQRKRSWLNQVAASRQDRTDVDGLQRPLMLILDVKT